MKSKTSSHKQGFKLCNPMIFRKDITRFWPLWLLQFIIYMLYCVLPLPSMAESLKNNTNAKGYISEMAEDVASRLDFPVFAFVVSIWCIAIAVNVFGYLTKERDAYTMHSFPIRRETIFCSHYLAGLVILVVPEVFTMLCMAGFSASQGLKIGSLFLVAIAEYLMEVIFFYSLACCVVMLTGNGLMSAVIYAVLNMLVSGIVYLCQLLASLFVFGSDIAGGISGLGDFCKFMTPVYAFILNATPDGDGSGFSVLAGASSEKMADCFQNLGFFAIYLIPAVLLVVIAIFLYRKRHLEVAGDMVAFSWGKSVFRVVFVFCASILFTLGVYYLGFSNVIHPLDYEKRFRICVVLLPLFTILSYLIVNMILEKTFFIWKKTSYPRMIFMAVVMVLGIFLLKKQAFGASMPSEKKIEAARIEFSGANGGLDEFSLTDQEQIGALYALNRQILTKAGRLTEDEKAAFQGDIGDSFDFVRIEYKLNRPELGSWFRSYAIPSTGELHQMVCDFFGGQKDLVSAYFTQYYESFAGEVEIQGVECDGQGYLCQTSDPSVIAFSGGKFETIFHAVLEDIRKGKIKPYCVMDDPKKVLASLTFYVDSGVDETGGYYNLLELIGDSKLYITEEATETVKALKDVGEGKYVGEDGE